MAIFPLAIFSMEIFLNGKFPHSNSPPGNFPTGNFPTAQNKPMHGQFLRQTKDLPSNDTWQWLQRGELRKETEGMIMAVQDQALRTRYIQRAIDRTNISPKCRKRNQKDETINRIASECPALAQNQYKKRHDTMARAMHWNLCKKYQMPCSNKWYEHQSQPVTENEDAKLLWDYSVRTDRVMPAH